jgi:hypothetical protein
MNIIDTPLILLQSDCTVKEARIREFFIPFKFCDNNVLCSYYVSTQYFNLNSVHCTSGISVIKQSAIGTHSAPENAKQVAAMAYRYTDNNT